MSHSRRGSNGLIPTFDRVPADARTHERIAERVSGISAANQFAAFVAVPPLSPLVHTEHVDNFVGLSQQERVARDAAELVSGALIKAGLPVHLAGISTR